MTNIQQNTLCLLALYPLLVTTRKYTKLPLEASLQGMEKCIPNLSVPFVQPVKYSKHLSEQAIMENTFKAEIRLVTSRL